MSSIEPPVPFDAKSITRPASELLTYYVILSFIVLPAIFITLPVLWFRYMTLRYQFDDEGVSMKWGLLFHRETVLTYRRIQDIHVTRDLLQRWLGLATVSIQTASGSGSPEMKLEGILQAEPLRDFLYSKMRGARDEIPQTCAAPAGNSTLSQATLLLSDIRDNLARLVERSNQERRS